MDDRTRLQRQPRLSPATITELITTHAHYAQPMQRRAAEIRDLERQLSTLVNQAYRLTDEDIDLLWRTAPPRMPARYPIFVSSTHITL